MGTPSFQRLVLRQNTVPFSGIDWLDRSNGQPVDLILNKSYADLLPMVSREGTFAYCDPPYYGTEKLYEKRFSLEDHYHLHELACDFAGYIMLSYNDCEFIRDLYRNDFYVESVERMNSIAQRYNPGGVYKELIITNYDPNEKRNQQPKQLSLLTS